jgi:hypothetical protein
MLVLAATPISLKNYVVAVKLVTLDTAKLAR